MKDPLSSFLVQQGGGWGERAVHVSVQHSGPLLVSQHRYIQHGVCVSTTLSVIDNLTYMAFPACQAVLRS